MYEGFQTGVINTTRFDENAGLSTPFLGRMSITRASKIKVEKRFLISE